MDITPMRSRDDSWLWKLSVKRNMKRSFVNTERFQEEVESVHFYRFDGHLSKDGVPPQMQWFIIRLQIWKNNKWRHTNFQTQPLFIDDYKGLYYALQWQSGFWASPVVVELVSYISSYIPILSSLYIYIYIHNPFYLSISPFYPQYLYHNIPTVPWLCPHHLIWLSWVHYATKSRTSLTSQRFFLRPSAHLWM